MKNVVYTAVAALFAFMVLMLFNCSAIAVVVWALNTFGEFGYNTVDAVTAQFKVSIPVTAIAAIVIAAHSMISIRLEEQR